MFDITLEYLIVVLIIIAIFGSLVVISECKYIGRSLLAFIFFSVLLAIIYLYIGAPIVAAFQILIYTGAVVAFMLLALSMMREEYAEGPALDLKVIARFVVGFIGLVLIFLVVYYWLPLDLLVAPNEVLMGYLDMSREYSVSLFMWEIRPVDATILGIMTIVLATGIRHFYREIMKRE